MIIASESFGISRMLPYEYFFNKYGSAEPQCVLEFYGDCLVASAKVYRHFMMSVLANINKSLLLTVSLVAVRRGLIISSTWIFRCCNRHLIAFSL